MREHIASKLIELREAEKMSIPAFAEFVGLHKATYRQFEYGIRLPSLSMLEKIANKTCVPMCYFFEGYPLPSNHSKGYLNNEIIRKMSKLTDAEKNILLGFIDKLKKQ